MADACRVLQNRGALQADPMRQLVAAVSVGIVGGVPVLDLDYAEDSSAETDMNVVMNNGGAFVEIQGTAEGHAFQPRRDVLARRLAQAKGNLLRAQVPSIAKESPICVLLVVR